MRSRRLTLNTNAVKGLHQDGLNETLAQLRETTVPVSEYKDLQNQLDAVNTTVVELRETIETRYTANEEHARVLRQVDALNETVTVLTERAERFKTRYFDAQRVYDSFIDTCREERACAQTLGLVQ
ncbi:hypothetical protein [Roseibium sp.]|uniref:hypothetical protein n=1 Tax=Roseibium sp. TaxID=1936156 RepID=UPI003D127C8A